MNRDIDHPSRRTMRGLPGAELNRGHAEPRRGRRAFQGDVSDVAVGFAEGREAAAMRVFAMSWMGETPKMRLMMRANRAAGSFAMRASSEGVSGPA